MMKRIRFEFKPFAIIIKLPDIFWCKNFTGFGWPKAFIFIRDLNNEFAEELVLYHEKIHHTQQRKEKWPFMYIAKYLYYNFTEGYRFNPYEWEAMCRTAEYYEQQMNQDGDGYEV